MRMAELVIKFGPHRAEFSGQQGRNAAWTAVKGWAQGETPKAQIAA
jgi:hypothetical protein